VTLDAAVDTAGAMTSGRPARLSRSADVQRTMRRGRSRAGDLMAVHVLVRPRTGLPEASEATGASGASGASGAPRLTVVASRRVGGAVRRNRAKRLLREAARPLPWRSGLDIVLVARAACAASGAADVRVELVRLAERLEAVLDGGVGGVAGGGVGGGEVSQ
jgi:ribonuclease P protein component